MPITVQTIKLPDVPRVSKKRQRARCSPERAPPAATGQPVLWSTDLCLRCYSPVHDASPACGPTREHGADSLPETMPEFPGASFLAAKNSHHNDLTIIFVESTHKYYVRWFPNSEFHTTTDTISVSGFIHHHFSTFDPDEAISKMQKGYNYRPGHPQWNKTPAEIKSEWEENGRVASSQGTKLHYLLECFYNGLDLRPWAHLRTMRQFLRWHSAHALHQWVPYRTEMRLRSPNTLRLTGTIDMLFVPLDHPPPAGCAGVLTLHMVDWKFSKCIKRDNRYQTGLGPCAHLPDCNFSHYSLQLNIYQTMLERYYTNVHYNGHVYDRISVASTQCVVFHDTREEAEIVKVERVSELVDLMFQHRADDLGKARGDDLAGRLQ